MSASTCKPPTMARRSARLSLGFRMSVFVTHEGVTCAAHRLEVTGVSWVFFQLGSQTRDQDVNRAVEGVLGRMLHETKELFAAEHSPRAFCQHTQQVELRRGE